MNTKRTLVRGLLDCAGAWGTLNIGEEKEIEVNIAESLILGGLAEEVFPDNGEVVIDRGDGIDAAEASAAGAVLAQYAAQFAPQMQAQQQEQEPQPAPEQVADEEREPETKEEHPRRRARKS